MNEDDPSSFLLKKNDSNFRKFSFEDTNTITRLKSGISEESIGNKSEDENLYNLFFRPVKHGSVRSSVFCMICVTLGTGMLPIPYLLSSNGIILTFILF